MGLRMSRTVAALLAVAVGAGAAAVGAGALPAGAAPSRAAATRSAPALSWHACDKRFRCAELAVPISYQQPGRGTLNLSVVMLPATGKHPIGDLVTNPGDRAARASTSWSRRGARSRRRFARRSAS